VVQGAQELVVMMTNGVTLEAGIVDTDPATDLAVIRARGSSLPYASLGNSSGLRVVSW